MTEAASWALLQHLNQILPARAQVTQETPHLSRTGLPQRVTLKMGKRSAIGPGSGFVVVVMGTTDAW
jgi:hypothetical protein